MSGVIDKFIITSMFMILAPVSILYAFNNGMLPGINHLAPHTLTLLSGLVAVISVNVVIAFYICMALKEPSDKHEPDPKFIADAKASTNRLTSKAADSPEYQKKEE